MHKEHAFYQNKLIYMLKPGFTLPKAGEICLLKFMGASFYVFIGSDEDLMIEKIRGYKMGADPEVFPAKRIFDSITFQKS